MKKILIKFLVYVAITVLVTYFMPAFVATLWYVVLLIMYSKSNDEPFWLAFFLTISDGFIGFLGSYSMLLSIIPGLPAIDIAQFYIIIAVIKIYKRKSNKPFFSKWMSILFIYAVLLVVIGMINGLTGATNIYFRIVKLIVPLVLFYTVPRLMKSLKDYEIFFHLIFVVFILGFAAQVFTVYTGFSPAGNLNVFEEEQMEAGKDLRSFYNTSITLVSLFGSIFFLSIKNYKGFPRYYLYVIAGMTFFMAFLSATRGWIISIGFILALFFVIVQKGKNIISIAGLFAVLIIVGMTNSKIREQISFSVDRFMTLEALSGGDQTANGSLLRLTERGPKVLSFWEQRPVFGWGWSNVFFENGDTHVGNQNILMHSGVVGFSLIIGFIIFIMMKMFSIYKGLNTQNNYKNTALAFIVFFVGWFFLHSTSGQQFCYGSLPDHIFPQAIFLGMASVLFNLIKIKPPANEI